MDFPKFSDGSEKLRELMSQRNDLDLRIRMSRLLSLQKGLSDCEGVEAVRLGPAKGADGKLETFMPVHLLVSGSHGGAGGQSEWCGVWDVPGETGYGSFFALEVHEGFEDLERELLGSVEFKVDGPLCLVRALGAKLFSGPVLEGWLAQLESEILSAQISTPSEVGGSGADGVAPRL